MLAARQAQLLAGSHALLMVLGYAVLWCNFLGFVALMCCAALPASEDTVIDFLTWLDLSGHSGRAGAAVSMIAREHVLTGLRVPSAGVCVPVI